MSSTRRTIQISSYRSRRNQPAIVISEETRSTVESSHVQESPSATPHDHSSESPARKSSADASHPHVERELTHDEFLEVQRERRRTQLASPALPQASWILSRSQVQRSRSAKRNTFHHPTAQTSASADADADESEDEGDGDGEASRNVFGEGFTTHSAAESDFDAALVEKSEAELADEQFRPFFDVYTERLVKTIPASVLSSDWGQVFRVRTQMRMKRLQLNCFTFDHAFVMAARMKSRDRVLRLSTHAARLEKKNNPNYCGKVVFPATDGSSFYVQLPGAGRRQVCNGKWISIKRKNYLDQNVALHVQMSLEHLMNSVERTVEGQQLVGKRTAFVNPKLFLTVGDDVRRPVLVALAPEAENVPVDSSPAKLPGGSEGEEVCTFMFQHPLSMVAAFSIIASVYFDRFRPHAT